MPRCRKRIVCKEPDVKVFIPQQNDNSEMLIMTVDEYESIRLIDLEGFSQEECANKLGVARTTAQFVITITMRMDIHVETMVAETMVVVIINL